MNALCKILTVRVFSYHNFVSNNLLEDGLLGIQHWFPLTNGTFFELRCITISTTTNGKLLHELFMLLKICSTDLHTL